MEVPDCNGGDQCDGLGGDGGGCCIVMVEFWAGVAVERGKGR